MGKKKTRTATTSKGQRRSVVNGVKEVRQNRSELDKGLIKLSAWRKGKNPWITVPGPGGSKQYTRIRSNDLWGNPKTNTSYGKG